MMAVHEAVVAGRFDALSDRFKAEVAADDPRLLAIVERLSPLAGRRILDLGCGKGRFARSLSERGAQVIGLDVSAGMLALAAGLLRVRASARLLPFGPASFDAALAVEVFEHLAPQALDHVCSEVLRVLRPGGTFVVVDKNAWSWNARRPWLPSLAVKWIDERRGLWMYSHRDPVRERWFRPSELKRRLSRWFPEVRVWHLLSRTEEGRFPFRWVPLARLLVLWSARAPGGSP
jgi:SAM-dependent methyltransferase